LTLRLYIDKEGGVTLDDCAAVSRQVSYKLDADDPIAQRYVLEVSSPGLDRPLHSARDFERFAGRQIRLSTIAPLQGRRNFVGRLVGLIEGMVRLVLEDGHEVAVPKDLVDKARLEPDYGGIGEHAAARGRHA
jgi:ribosome maturation factor RimP